MGELPGIAMVVGILAAAVGVCLWLAARVRRRGTGGAAIRAAMSAYDEALHGTANDAYVEIRLQERRKVPVRSPDDPWHPSRCDPTRRDDDRTAPPPRSRARRTPVRGRLRRLWSRRASADRDPGGTPRRVAAEATGPRAGRRFTARAPRARRFVPRTPTFGPVPNPVG
ncbi:hypothetical protein [Embleya hyalina]|uniref:Secreted protein n=1 Tax=Embleya hyalina TaxID=516124 RepID=A0A401YIT7_9ACTN|nr:hypothetical protein [Embleya hyalina]GCD94534.1 hypothetical protein EHYA_02203 [Embleya hyalina]